VATVSQRSREKTLAANCCVSLTPARDKQEERGKKGGGTAIRVFPSPGGLNLTSCRKKGLRRRREGGGKKKRGKRGEKEGDAL